jgi:hypothetical protein
MPNISKSAKLYQERRQPDIRKTYRGPGPYVDLWANKAHHLDLAPPLPAPETKIDTAAPDSTRTTVWPFGDKYAT